MKSVYDLTVNELKAKEKEFNKTAYGKKLLTLRYVTAGITCLFVIILLFDGIKDENSNIQNVITNGIMWLGILINGCVDYIGSMMYGRELRKYIETKNN